MASFADKVRSTNAVPSSNGQQRGEPVIPTTTDEIEEDLIEAITLQSNEAGIHPTKATDGEQLPEGYSRSYGGFFLRQNHASSEWISASYDARWSSFPDTF